MEAKHRNILMPTTKRSKIANKKEGFTQTQHPIIAAVILKLHIHIHYNRGCIALHLQGYKDNLLQYNTTWKNRNQDLFA